ncbi:thiaminase II [Bacillus lacus]|uniref:Aminopyrimidine aminohydrolase n=1 Tax=Metabacillus lacus TaxID=1983721 RepID=A0A7X2J340_9BACI|nr:thiaminase II [Metabacillus lacus]MRX73708.1 thiaminase II [Metabacillus lacus]
MSFSALCREHADQWWEGSFQHPFVQGIGSGELSLESFKYYVMQDSYYLAHFAKIQSFGAAHAKDLHTTNRMAIHAQGTYEAEMALHKSFSVLLNITEDEVKSFRPAPTAYAYTSHLYRAAMSGDLGNIIAALLPCYWLYLEVGERLKHEKPESEVYQEWISAYNGDWFRELVEEQIQRLDELAEKAGPEQKQEMMEYFWLSSYYEYYFWEMAYKREGYNLTEEGPVNTVL